VNVNAVQQGPGNFRNVALDHRRRAVALPRRVTKISTGQGFIAAASMNREGNVTETAAREMVPRRPPAAGASLPERFANSGSSSRKSHRYGRANFSGRGTAPPPINPASLIVWCGER